MITAVPVAFVPGTYWPSVITWRLVPFPDCTVDGSPWDPSGTSTLWYAACGAETASLYSMVACRPSVMRAETT